MAIDIALKGVTIKHNGLSRNMRRGAAGILSISWFHCRPDLNEPVLKWIIKLEDINNEVPVSLDKFKSYEKLAFRQNALGQSILKIEVITSLKYSIIAKLVVGIVSLGIKTISGLIANPVASSLFDTFVSQMDLDLKNPTIYKVGIAEYILNPNAIPDGEIPIPLMMNEDFVIQKELKTPATGEITQEGIIIPAGPNGVVTLNISKFDASKVITTD